MAVSEGAIDDKKKRFDPCPIHTDRELLAAVSSSMSEVNESFEEILLR